MDKKLLLTLEEWTRLESSLHRARRDGCEAGRHQAELAEKESEILEMRAPTKRAALVHLRFCATFIEQNCGDRSILAMGAIRHAINVLSRGQAT